jgi:cell division protein FtsB
MSTKTATRLLVILMIVLFLFFSAALLRQYAKRQALLLQADELQKELSKLKMEKNNLWQSLDFYASDLFVEQEARTKFNYQKEGERVVVVPLGATAIEQPANRFLQIKGNQNIKDWLNYFLN